MQEKEEKTINQEAENQTKKVQDDKKSKGKKIEEKRGVRKKANKIVDVSARIKKIKRALLIMLIFLLIIYFALRVAYDTGRFTVVLDTSSDMKGALVMYANKNEKLTRRTLSADVLDFMTNISEDWLPENIDDEADGGHNGENYIAYTFYIENMGDETIHYWYRIHIDDVVKNVDKAIRVAVYLNGEKTVYAKANERTSKPEENTTAFKDEESVMLVQRRDFKSKDVDKFTVVIWVEGDDPDCIDDLIGGEMKMHMTITEEHIKQE